MMDRKPQNENKWTRANRETIITGYFVEELPVGSLGRPKLSDLEEFDDHWLKKAIANGETIWCQWITTKTGFDTEVNQRFYYPSETAALDAREPLGTKWDGLKWLAPATRDFTPGSLCAETQISASGFRGEAPYSLIYEALHGAGLYNGYLLSDKVKTWLGAEGIEWLEGQYGENWKCVALLGHVDKWRSHRRIGVAP